MYRQGQRPLTTLNLSYPLVHVSLHRVVRPRTTSRTLASRERGFSSRAALCTFTRVTRLRARENVQNGIHLENIFFVVVVAELLCRETQTARVSSASSEEEWLSNDVRRVLARVLFAYDYLEVHTYHVLCTQFPREQARKRMLL